MPSTPHLVHPRPSSPVASFGTISASIFGTNPSFYFHHFPDSSSDLHLRPPPLRSLAKGHSPASHGHPLLPSILLLCVSEELCWVSGGPSKLRDRVISVEYAVSDDDGRRNGYSPDKRGRDRSSDRRNRECGRSASSSRTYANLRPAKTLFIVNFDPVNTRKLDLEMHFEPYGKILDVRIRKTFAFIQFESQEDATKALEATHMSKLLDHVISVEYAACDDDRNGYSPDRKGRDQSRGSRSRDCELSVSPRRGIKRASPDYSRDPSPYRKRELSGSHSSGGAASPVY